MRRVPDQCLLLPLTDESKAVRRTPAVQRLITAAITFPVAPPVRVAAVAAVAAAVAVVVVVSLGLSWR